MWNWELPEWPEFSRDAARFAEAERVFVRESGVFAGTVTHLDDSDRDQITVEALSDEAATTSEIEGEILDRASVQSSVRRELGLTPDNRRSGPKERGVAEMMVDVHRSFGKPLSEATLCGWHRMLMTGRGDLTDVGRYRKSGESMEIVSGPLHKRKVHFEAPPSTRVRKEMGQFVRWYNDTAPRGREPLPGVTRAGIAHLYFESIHPFEDGNGRVGRAISEKSLAQSLGQPTLTVLAAIILARRKEYYASLEAANKQNEITNWLAWFAGIAIEAQQSTNALVEFLIEKTKLLDRLRGKLNSRQEKALVRMFREGPHGFKGGLSAGNYSTITGASPATATRDLADLVEKAALTRTGERKHARYQVAVPLRETSRVSLNERGDLVES